ncbi:hypothetical protein AB0H76_05395 [Nocardia sp. NPDC050712]|uniref:hypothetical protein n=1 Tax=Nocardia sp. NPDC050712 TaxID=3155518 RepID=UPI0033C65F17
MILSDGVPRSTIESRDRKRIQDGYPTHEEVRALLHRAALALYRNERELIDHNVHEQALGFRIGLFLANTIERPDSKLHVDSEYNRQGTKPKVILSQGRIGKRPDLVIHVRDTNESNLLAVEIKKSAEAIEDDLERLCALQSDPFHYHDAVLLILGATPQWRWIRTDPELTEIPCEQRL